jgi:6-phosphogluconolactonase (cycloisomerase 2 family)
MFAYVGCYTTPDRDGRGEGIGVYRVDPDTGAWTQVQLLRDVPNPSFLALDSRHRNLYCVHGGNDYSRVSAFAIDASSGELTPLGSQECGGPNPVGLSVGPDDAWLVTANYNNGTVGALPLDGEGRIQPLSDLFMLQGEHGPHPTEQTTSHPHHIPYDPARRFFVVPDKGLDRVFVFGVDPETGKIAEGDPPSVQSAPGAAPRHASFQHDGSYLYCINEINSTLTSFAYDGERGGLREVQVVSTLPPDFKERSTTAEIHVAPSGRFVYGSNRGHNSIVIFAVDSATGTLELVGWEPTQGRQPRYFGIDTSGQFLYAANQGSDTIVTFRVDQERGTLTPTGQVIEFGSPVCIVFAEP